MGILHLFKKSTTADIAFVDLTSESPLLAIKGATTPELPLIAVGGAGIAIANAIQKRMQAYSVDYPIAAIDLHWQNLEDSTFHSILQLGTSKLGTACQYRKAVTVAEQENDKLQQFTMDYLNSFGADAQHEVVFLLLGSGGTGVGVSLQLIKILKAMKYRPVPIFILPFTHEMTRTKFTAAAGLYLFSYAPGDRSEKLMTLCINNQLFLNKITEKLPQEELLVRINDSIAAAIADLFISTTTPESGYSTDLNEFLEVFRTVRGFGTILSLDSLATTDLSELYTNNNSRAVALHVNPTASTRSYTFIQGQNDIITAENYRNFFSQFDNSDLFHKLSLVDSDAIAIRGVYVGYKISPEIKRLILVAEDARVTVLNREKNEDGNINSKIDHLKSDEEVDVKLPEEIRDELAKESAALRRGEHSE